MPAGKNANKNKGQKVRPLYVRLLLSIALLLMFSVSKPLIINKEKQLTFDLPTLDTATLAQKGAVLTNDQIRHPARYHNALKALRDSSWFIRDDEGETLFCWLDTYTYSKGIVTVKLSESLRPYLLAQSRDFTQYQLLGALALKSKHSIRLYEMLLCDVWKKRPIVYSVDALREIFAQPGMLMAYKNFKKLVITAALDEINRVTNISVSYDEARTAEGVQFLTFYGTKSALPILFQR